MLEIPFIVQLQVLGAVALSALLGAIIGMERKKSDKPAGTRTMSLIAAGSTLVVAMGGAAAEVTGFGDPARSLQAVITGIGFLGAGMIVQTVDGTHRTAGVTTAATVFATAAIGVTVGLGGWIVAVGGTLVILLTLRSAQVLDSVEKASNTLIDPVKKVSKNIFHK